jgi:dienelactone hydrolase
VRRVVASVLSSVGLVAVLAVGCAADDTSDASVRPSTTATTATSTTSISTTVAESTATVPVDPNRCPGGGAHPIGTYAVGRSERVAIDPSRPTTPRPEWADRAAPHRTLPYVVLYPSAPGDGNVAALGIGTPDAPPSSDGPFPVVMWSHGMASAGVDRNDTLARWASVGYVVVAPTFPLSTRAPDASDLLNQPGDVAFVLDQVRAAATTEGDVLHGQVRAECVALAGHSMGGGTTIAAAFDPRVASIRPRAIVDIAGLLPKETAGVTIDSMPPLPALVVHGDADPTVPYWIGEDAVASLHGPTWFLTLLGGEHSDIFDGAYGEVLDRTVTAFLDAELKASPAALDALPAELAPTGTATLAVLPPR